jgi:hypothetical protein
MTNEQFQNLCNTYGFAPSRALRELLDTAIAQSRITGSPHCERSCEANAFQIEIRRLKAQLSKDDWK